MLAMPRCSNVIENNVGVNSLFCLFNLLSACRRFCGGVGGPNEVEGNPRLKDAYEMGRAV